MNLQTKLIALAMVVPIDGRADDRVDYITDKGPETLPGKPSRKTNDWMTAEVPAAVSVMGGLSSRTLPGMGAYRDNGLGAIGIRLRAGGLTHADAQATRISRVFASTGVAVRIGVNGPWYENVFGVGVAGSELAGVYELAFGWQFELGKLDMGTSLRYVHVDGPPEVDGGLLLLGADVAFGKRTSSSKARVGLAAVAPPPPPVEVTKEVAKVEPSCASIGVHCDSQFAADITAGRIQLHETGVVIDEGLLFDGKGDHLHSHGLGLITAIATYWDSHPAWRHIWIETCTGDTSSFEDDPELSSRRIDEIRSALIDRGVAAARIAAIGPVAMPADRLAASIHGREPGVGCAYCLEFVIQPTDSRRR